MWRTVVIGKLVISIIAALIVAIFCFVYASRAEDWAGLFRWGALGLFFAVLVIAFSGSLYLLHWRKKG